MSFVVSGFLFLATLFFAVLTALVAGGVEAPQSPGSAPWWVLGLGTLFSAFIASTHWHWLPHLTW
jgi:hypothetical protein